MKDSRFTCPQCSQPLEAPADMQGDRIPCPACDKEITIPSLANSAPPHRSKESHTKISSPLRGSNRWKLLIGAGCLLCAIWLISLRSNDKPTLEQSTGSAQASSTRVIPITIDQSPYAVEAATGIDRTLLFIRYINALSDQWPGYNENRELFAKAVVDYKNQLSLATEYVESQNLDKELLDLLKGHAELLDVYLSVLRTLYNIDEAAIERASREITESSFSAGFAGGQAAAIAADHDAGFLGSAIIGLGTYALSMWLQESEKSTVRRQAHEALVEREVSRFSTALSRYESLMRTTSATLSSRHKWKQEEAGHLLPQSHIDQKQAAAERGDYRTLAALLRSECAARPRDPFIHAHTAWAETWANGEVVTEATFHQSKERTLRALSLLPQDAFYNSIRSAYYGQAGLFSLAALNLSSNQKGYAGGPYDSAETIRLFLAAQQYDPYDSDGSIRIFLARSYALAGHFDNAIRLAEEVRPHYSHDPDYWYDLACIYSVAGRHERAWQYLEYSIKGLAFADVKLAKTDPDLAAVRRKYADEFTNVTSVRTRANIEWGFFNDDVILRNDSTFPLTNVRFTPRITSRGRVFTKELKAEYIAPGRSHKWVDVFSIPGNVFDSYHYTVVSDQGAASTQ